MKPLLTFTQISLLFTTLLLYGCGGSGSSDDSSTSNQGEDNNSPDVIKTAVLNLNVIDDRGFALDGAGVSIGTDTTPGEVSATGSTNDDGRLAFEVDNGATAILRVSLDGHTEQTRRVNLPAGAVAADATIALRRLEKPIVMTASENGGDVAGLDGVSLSVPAGGAFADSNGNPVVGDVDVFMSPIDVTDDRAVRAFPGDFAGVTEDGGLSPIASFGVADYRFFQDGEELELADGQTATIRIPLYASIDLDGTELAVGASLPLWSLDENTGIWQQEGSGTVVADAASPTGFVVEGEVTHFSPWNIDKPVNIFEESRDNVNPSAPQITVRVACGAPGTPCDPGLPPVQFVLKTAVPGMAVVRFEFLLPVDAERVLRLPTSTPLELEAQGVDGSFGTEVVPTDSFTLAAGDEREFEAVLKPLNEIKNTFTPPLRLRGEMKNLGETHDYLFDVRAGESLSVAAFAIEDLFSPASRSGQLGGRLSVLNNSGDVVASEVFDAFQDARIDLAVDVAGTWSLRVEAEGKVPGFYVVTAGLRPLLIGRQYLKPTAAFSDLKFGGTVAMDGRRLVVGRLTPNQNPVFVFERDDEVGWRQVAEILGSGRIAKFGQDVDIDGDTIVVGDPSDSTPGILNGVQCKLPAAGNHPSDGAAYVFRRDADGAWEFEACLKMPVPARVQNPDFGQRVAISGNTIAVSDPTDTVGDLNDLSNPMFSGAIHIYERDDATGDWGPQATIRSPLPLDRGEMGGFGLDLDGDTLVVSENGGDDASRQAQPGAVHVFERSNKDWSLVASFHPVDISNSFSMPVAIDGDVLVAGAPGEERESGLSSSGAVFVFERGTEGWTQGPLLEPPQPGASDFFGWSVDIDGDDLVVGALFEDSGSADDTLDNSASNSGAAYRARRETDGSWTFTQFLKATAIDGGDNFGRSVAIGQDSVVVGSPNDDGVDGDPESSSASNSGAVYAFPR